MGVESFRIAARPFRVDKCFRCCLDFCVSRRSQVRPSIWPNQEAGSCVDVEGACSARVHVRRDRFLRLSFTRVSSGGCELASNLPKKQGEEEE